MSDKWYTRPVFFVTDINRSVDFYVKQFGFKENWRFTSEGGEDEVAQVARPGIELILSSEEDEGKGKGLIFISLDLEVLLALRAEMEGRGVAVTAGIWGYRVMIIADPDGNKFYFASDEGTKLKGTL